MECSNGLCETKIYVAESDITPQESAYCERLLFESNAFQDLMLEYYNGYIKLPENKGKELQNEYLKSFASHQIAMRMMAKLHFSKEELDGKSIEINFDRNKIYLY